MTPVSFLSSLFGVDEEDALALVKDWDVTEATRNGESVAIVMVSGTEIHFAIYPGKEKKALSRANIRAYLAPILDKYGMATTRVPVSETNHKLREHLGFHWTWSDGVYNYFALTELPYRKEKLCQ